MKNLLTVAIAVLLAFTGAYATTSNNNEHSNGTRVLADTQTCPTCNGTGKVKINVDTWDTCKTCNGTGKISK